nr:hypothetical protein CFP56_19772 [Quercus suber]
MSSVWSTNIEKLSLGNASIPLALAGYKFSFPPLPSSSFETGTYPEPVKVFALDWRGVILKQRNIIRQDLSSRCLQIRRAVKEEYDSEEFIWMHRSLQYQVSYVHVILHPQWFISMGNKL